MKHLVGNGEIVRARVNLRNMLVSAQHKWKQNKPGL